MAERVSTGGNVSFVYKKEKKKLDEERKNDIEQGYREFYERRKRQKRNRLIIAVIVLIVLVVLGFVLFT